MRLQTAGGNEPKNQEIKYEEDGEVFVSYGTKIAKKTYDGKILLDKRFWDYSVTTGRYRNQFLGEGIADTRKNIKNGVYILTDLN